MTAEKFIIAWLKNQMIPKTLTLQKEKALEGVVIDNNDIPKEESKSVELVDNYFDINKLFVVLF